MMCLGGLISVYIPTYERQVKPHTMMFTINKDIGTTPGMQGIARAISSSFSSSRKSEIALVV